MIEKLGIPDLELSPWEDAPVQAIQSLNGHEDWIVRAKELVPEFVDLRNQSVRGGFFGETGTARGLIWDLLEAVKKDTSAETLDRVFAYILYCVRSEIAELYNPAAIGFLCRVAGPDAPLSFHELAARLSEDDLADISPLFEHHYGSDGLAQIQASKAGRGKH